MSLGQIIMYFNLGMDLKYGTGVDKDGKPTLKHKSYAELKKMKEEMEQMNLIEKKKPETDRIHAEMKAKYGSIDE